MSRHVVLLRRDPSLGLALRALLHGTGRVTELGNIQAWSTVPADTIDAVVIDLPVPRRKQAIELVRSRFGGRLVLVLDPIDDPAAVPTHHACSVVQRPFEIVELWHLVTTDPTPAARAPGPAPAGAERPPAATGERAAAERGVGAGRDPGAGAAGPRQDVGSAEPPAGRRAEPARPTASTSRERDAAPTEPGPTPAPTRDPAAPDAPGGARPPAADASTWRWRGRRYGPATAIPPAPTAGEPGTGGTTGAAGAKPGPRPGEPARAAGDAAPAASSGGVPPVPAGPTDQSTAASGGPAASDPAAKSGSEGRRWGALPRRSADSRAAPPSQETGGSGAGRPAGPDAADPPAGRDADPGTTTGTDPKSARPASPAGPRGTDPGPPTARPAPPTADPAPSGTAAPAGPAAAAPAAPADPASGGLAPSAAAAAAAAPSPGGPVPERPSILRRLTGRLGGRKPEGEVAQAPPDVRSASNPAFEPAPAPPQEAPQRPSGPPAWPSPSVQSRPAPEEVRSRPTPTPTPTPRPTPRSEPQPAPPRAAPAPSPAPAQPVRPARPEQPARPAGDPPARPDPPRDPAGPAGRRRRPSRPASSADLPPAKPGPQAPPSTRREPEPPAARQALPPQDEARPGREPPEAAPAGPAADAASVANDPGDADPATVQATTAAATAPLDQAASPSRRGPEPRRRQGRRQGTGGPPSPGAPSSPPRPPSPPPGPTPTGREQVGEGDRPRRPPPVAQAQPPVAPPRPESAPPPEPPGAGAPGEQAPEPAAKARPVSGPLGVSPDAPEVLLAAEEAADAPPGPTPGIPASPPGAAPSGTGAGDPATAEGPQDRWTRGRRARSLLRFTAPRRPETTEREVSAPDAATPLADFDRLTQSIESVTEALGGQPLEFYERDLPQIAAAETARRVRADVVVLLLDNGEGLMEVSGGVGLTPAERRLSVEYSRDVMRELFRAGVGLIEDTDRVRGALAGIPGSRAETLVMVPLVHERLGFGVLMAGRNRSQTGVPTEVFDDAEIEVLMGFADAAAASLRTAVLLRHLKGQLRALEDDG